MTRRLNNAALASLPQEVRKPDYDRTHTECGIVHLGPGAFHRAHQAVYTDMAMAHGGNWRITGVSMRSATLKDKLAEQDNLYSLVILDNEPYVQVIGAFADVLVLDQDRQKIMAAMTSPSTHIISLTVTEKGYCLNSHGELDSTNSDIEHDIEHPDAPISAIGLISLALKQRRDAGYADITVISCDNLADNGKKLASAVKGFAKRVDPELASWIDQNISFPCTMVDSITPATDEALLTLAKDKLGVEDQWPIQREGFTQWVVEDDFSGPRPQWEKVGVTFTQDVAAYENAKLRILNGTHSTLAYMGTLFGKETVYEAVCEKPLEQFLSALLQREIIPSIADNSDMDLAGYANDILTRYQNKHIRHLLSQIAWDGSQKLPFRILNTIRDNFRLGHSTSLLCVPIAAWILVIAKRHNDGEKLVDPLADTLMTLAEKHADNVSALAKDVLALRQVFAELSDNTEFCNCVLEHVTTLHNMNKQQIADIEKEFL